MKIEVTQKHIDNGHKIEANACPIALAINEKITFLENVWVSYTHVTMWNCFRSGTNVQLPDDARYFVMRFDKGLNVKPFTFELDV